MGNHGLIEFKGLISDGYQISQVKLDIRVLRKYRFMHLCSCFALDHIWMVSNWLEL